MILEFNPDIYKVVNLEQDGITIEYRVFENLNYMEHPVHEIQKLSVYVPEVFYKGESINGYSLNSAPIFMPNTVGGYMPGPQEAPGKNFRGETNTTFYALNHGYVVVSAGVRGRGQIDADGKNVGMAPADICDLKAAVRFIRHNKEVFPGDCEKIITNGTSAGGAMSSLQGSTGNHPDYEPYLEIMGAAKERDDVFASSCYCPITNLEHADMAYEWEFCGLNDYHRMIYEKGITIEGDMTEEQVRLSKELKAAFPAYFNQLGLKDDSGKVYQLDENGDGEFKNLVFENVILSAQIAYNENPDQFMTEIKGMDWLEVKGGKVLGLDWQRFVNFRTRMKPAPAFDDIDPATPENELFGCVEEHYRHFTDFSQQRSHTGASIAESDQIKLMNPMNYIDDDRATKAKYYRICHGAIDRDTSLAVSEMLALKLKNAGCDVQLYHPWNIPHAGDYDIPQLFAWIDSVCR